MQEEGASGTDSLQYPGLAQRHGELGPTQVLPLQEKIGVCFSQAASELLPAARG